LIVIQQISKKGYMTLAAAAPSPAKPVRRTQAERRNESERSLVLAAIAVIAREGVAAVTFEAVGRAGGFSRGLATQRFGSKQGLIEAVLAYLNERQEKLVAAHGLDAMPGFKAVLAYVDVCLRDLASRDEGRAYFRLLSHTVADASTLSEPFRANHALVEDRLKAWILRGQAEGEIARSVDPQAAALMIGCLMLGMSMQLMVDPAMDMARLRETSLQMLTASLAAQSAFGSS
jgi:AcrR family transcriptional regulator